MGIRASEPTSCGPSRSRLLTRPAQGPLHRVRLRQDPLGPLLFWVKSQACLAQALLVIDSTRANARRACPRRLGCPTQLAIACSTRCSTDEAQATASPRPWTAVFGLPGQLHVLEIEQ